MTGPNDTQPGIELLDFWAAWCGPCKIMALILKEIEEEFKGKISIRTIDVDDAQNQDLVGQYQVMSIPTYIILKGGQVIDHFIGVQAKDSLAKRISAAIVS